MEEREKTEEEKMECNECDQKIVYKTRDGKRYLSIGSTYIVTDTFTLSEDEGKGGHILLCQECYDFYYRESVEVEGAHRHESRKLLKKYRNREEIDFDLVG